MAMLKDGTEVDDELVILAQKLSANSKTRKPFLKLVKEVDPDVPLPEVEMEADIERATAPLREEIKKLKDENEKNASFLNIQNKRKPLKEAGLSDTEIDKVEKFMVEKGIANHATALEHIRLNETVAKPREAGGARQPMTLPDIVTKEFFADPAKEARKIAGTVLNEIRSGKSA